MGNIGKFVFVVCGTKEHIDTLHYSLKFLKKYSSNEIIILTDAARNELPISFENVIDVKTPEHFSHHQASVYLKTAIHKFLPEGNNYCYLDSDVIALSPDVDEIFNHPFDVVSFAADHCKMRKFSPYAVNCNCLETQKKMADHLDSCLNRLDLNKQIHDKDLIKKGNQLQEKYVRLRKNKLKYFGTTVKYFLSGENFKLDEETIYNKRKKYWTDLDGNIILYGQETFIKDVEIASGFRWDRFRKIWKNKEGRNVYEIGECDHLAAFINKKFGLTIKEKNFQHWNGGVFLFNNNSHKFLDSWHEKTMAIFSDPEWKTRDQGTLIATAWEFGIQNQIPLSKKFNFIADYYNSSVKVNAETGELTDDNWKHKVTPAFVHVYHHFGTKGWDIWDWIESKETEPI
jgi:hypothetical protein